MVDTMDELIARVQQQMYRLRDLNDATAAILATETSEDGAVTASVDGNGALVDLRLGGAIAKLSPADFEQTLVDTARAAAHRAFAERADLVTAYNQESAG
ncbi:YbaB/EbfC DNA-binding family protein [Nocardia tenerifensis]|uniref:YbaB/EbfC DNA-binding family protein n=1 Tax=Nocardia tenerifensis TaxID=228006 RepID=A0A318K9W3_9NOCA|nr:YbaB/EbfC family nucleoid-associated protein [Nocardia tenerifensis]PXX66585.1 YbaB/EbfC DNA-binding family protein [Nocardia tenerifensis]